MKNMKVDKTCSKLDELATCKKEKPRKHCDEDGWTGVQVLEKIGIE